MNTGTVKSWSAEHPLIVEDIEDICRDENIPWSDLRDATILVTGATGLIGSLLVKTLIYRAVSSGCKLRVLALVRNIDKARELYKAQLPYEGSNLVFVRADINAPLDLDEKVDYIVHAASVTSSQDFVSKPVDTILTTLRGTWNMLELSRQKNSRSIVFLSSLEVYGQLDHECAVESDNGILDILSVRNSYPQSKRMAESMCVAYHAQYGINAKIVRLTQTFGPGVDKNDGRVFAQFARSVIENKDIVLLSRGGTCRDYLYTADAVRGILSVLLLGKGGEAYNLSDPDSYISIMDMANMCKDISGTIDVKFDVDKEASKKYLGEIKITLNNDSINELNNFERRNVRDSFIRMIEAFGR